MTDRALEFDISEIDLPNQEYLDKGLTLAVRSLVNSYGHDEHFENMDSPPIPDVESVAEVMERARRIIFPGYFSGKRLDSMDLGHYIEQEIRQLFRDLADLIALSTRHDCPGNKIPCPQCAERGGHAALQFIRDLPELRESLSMDVRAAMAGDPAAKSHDEIILSYPGLYAINIYRIAHELHRLGVPLLPRRMTEYAHGRTGIDIHPGAVIGKSFFIDHGTGVVIGETTEIGDRVRIYQGVTLGALSLPRGAVDNLRGRKRHPTVEDDVVIYSNATILGEKAVIGERSIIGGNVWITGPVPPDTKVLLENPELVYIGNNTPNKDAGQGKRNDFSPQ